MTDEELDAGIAFVLRHGAGTGRDVVAALVEKCDRMTMECAELRAALIACKNWIGNRELLNGRETECYRQARALLERKQ